MAVSINPQAMIHAPRPLGLEEAATRFAALDPIEAEATINGLVTGAIAGWRLEDATYWQRVKFRARLIRSMRRNVGVSNVSEAQSLLSAAKSERGDR